MGKKEKKAAKPAKAEGKKDKAAKADKPGTAKYTYPKDCVTDADKKKYRSIMRSGGTWTGPGSAKAAKGKKEKKDHGPGKAVNIDSKGKKVREEVNPGEKKKKKKEAATAED